ncbi:hypothetical protein KLA_17534, partial [Cellulophaga geojensis KL-A]
MFKKLFFYSWFLVFWGSCAQNTKTTKNMNTADQDSITIHNVTDKMWQAKPNYNKQPMYLLRINQEYCT